jgi:hypothetical protein
METPVVASAGVFTCLCCLALLCAAVLRSATPRHALRGSLMSAGTLPYQSGRCRSLPWNAQLRAVSRCLSAPCRAMRCHAKPDPALLPRALPDPSKMSADPCLAAPGVALQCCAVRRVAWPRRSLACRSTPGRALISLISADPCLAAPGLAQRCPAPRHDAKQGRALHHAFSVSQEVTTKRPNGPLRCGRKSPSPSFLKSLRG